MNAVAIFIERNSYRIRRCPDSMVSSPSTSSLMLATFSSRSAFSWRTARSLTLWQWPLALRHPLLLTLLPFLILRKSQ